MSAFQQQRALSKATTNPAVPPQIPTPTRAVPIKAAQPKGDTPAASHPNTLPSLPPLGRAHAQFCTTLMPKTIKSCLSARAKRSSSFNQSMQAGFCVSCKMGRKLGWYQFPTWKYQSIWSESTDSLEPRSHILLLHHCLR